MFHRILVPLDFTDKNIRALEVALELAKQNKASVVLLHVIETIEHIPTGELEGFYAKLEGAARARMAFPSSMFLEKGLVVEPEIVYGKRAEEIVKYVTANEVDLIVMSSHKINPEQPAQSWEQSATKLPFLRSVQSCL